jgi:hypothetical protein
MDPSGVIQHGLGSAVISDRAGTPVENLKAAQAANEHTSWEQHKA